MSASRLFTLILDCIALGLLVLLVIQITSPNLLTTPSLPETKYSVYIDGDYYAGVYQTNDYQIHDHMTVIKDAANGNKELIIRQPHVIIEN